MSIKKSILILEKDLKRKFPELNAAFYSTRRNMCVHIGLGRLFLLIQISIKLLMN